MNTIAHNIVGLTRERAIRFALAYYLAFVLALYDHAERVTGRTDLSKQDITDAVPLGGPLWNEIWQAESTGNRARELMADAEMLAVMRKHPAIVALAEEFADHLLTRK